MNTPELLDELRLRGIEVRLSGDALRLIAEPGQLTADLQNRVRTHKAAIVEALQRSRDAQAHPAIVPLQASGARAPVFGVAGHNGDIFCYRALAAHLGNEQPLYGLQPPGLDGAQKPLESVEQLAGYFADQVISFQASGPFVVAGYCAGGTVAWELVRQLRARNRKVENLFMIGAPHPCSFGGWRESAALVLHRARGAARQMARIIREPALVSVHLQRLRKLARQSLAANAALDSEYAALRFRVEEKTLAAVRSYRPAFQDVSLTVFSPCPGWVRSLDAAWKWLHLTPRSQVLEGPVGSNGDVMLLEPIVVQTAAQVRRRLDQINAGLAESI